MPHTLLKRYFLKTIENPPHTHTLFIETLLRVVPPTLENKPMTLVPTNQNISLTGQNKFLFCHNYSHTVTAYFCWISSRKQKHSSSFFIRPLSQYSISLYPHTHSQQTPMWPTAMAEGYGIDLTYITERIIAISFPQACPEETYLQNLRDITVMLKSKHGHNYMVRERPFCSPPVYHPTPSSLPSGPAWKEPIYWRCSPFFRSSTSPRRMSISLKWTPR